jgi:tripartite-type tricarboxylate transporter receptor subunit TctC
VPNAAARAFWYSFNVPAETPAPLIEALHAALKAALEAPETGVALRPLGIQVVASSPQGYRRFLLEETERRSEMARFAGVVPE